MKTKIKDGFYYFPKENEIKKIEKSGKIVMFGGKYSVLYMIEGHNNGCHLTFLIETIENLKTDLKNNAVYLGE